MHALVHILGFLLVTSVSTGEPEETELSAEEQALIEQAIGEDVAESKTPGPKPLIIPSQPIRPAGNALTTPAMMNPAIALIADFAVAYFSSDSPLQLGAHDPSRTGFTLQQLELHAESKIDHHFDLQVNLVFSEFGVELEELYVQTLDLPASLKLRAGQFLLPFGRVNPTHPHSWHFVDQALMVGTFFGGEGGRGLGIETSWLMPIPWYAKLTAAVNQKTGQCCTLSFFDPDEAPIDGLEDFLYTGRLEQFFDLSRAWSLLVGTSYMLGQNGTGPANQSHLRAGDVFIKYQPSNSPNRFYTSVQAEWTQRQKQVPGAVYDAQAGYLAWVVGLSPAWELGARVEWLGAMNGQVLDPTLEGKRSRYTAQVTWYPSHFSRVRLQGSLDEPDWLDEPIAAGMLAFEVLAGAHSAHVY